MTLLTRRSALAGIAALGLTRAARADSSPILLRDLYNKDLSFSDLAEGLQG